MVGIDKAIRYIELALIEIKNDTKFSNTKAILKIALQDIEKSKAKTSRNMTAYEDSIKQAKKKQQEWEQRLKKIREERRLSE